MKTISNKFNLCVVVILCASISSFYAQDVAWSKTFSALIRKSETEDKRKIPLILIHGVHGTEKCEDRMKNEESNDWEKDYWTKFKELFRKSENSDLRDKYELYIFQYCSDQIAVSRIASELHELIKEGLRGRNHVIVAHSMGGLVAKSYMAEFNGGAATIGLITLATPHHGTPGANDIEVLKPYIEEGWGNKVIQSQKYYWAPKFWIIPKGWSLKSNEANRSDLRWDNYDKAFGEITPKNDGNFWLFDVNQKLISFRNKIIAYAGVLRENDKWAWNLVKNKHEQLEIANNTIFKGFKEKFGKTDGLVPYASALLCTTNQPINHNGIYPFCDSPVRVRRFEPGNGETVRKKELLPYQTLSIDRRQYRGYDHLNMFTHDNVLEWVMIDLRESFVTKTQPIPQPPVEQPPVTTPKIPTLFLFDVSGSMNENGKINQARDAGLDALREMRDAGGAEASPVSIMTFSGNSCGGNATQNLLGFTSVLSEAERKMRSLPAPNGGTPLPQAKDAAWAEMQRFLGSNPGINDGRIVLLSDGQSTCGAIRPPGVFSREVTPVSRSDSKIKFFTIGFDVPPGSEAERDLQYLASITGGKYFPAADRRQLIRAFQKHARRFAPFQCRAANADLSSGIRGFANSDYRLALESFQKYVAANPNDSCAAYNLALAFEANDRYKTAAEIYRQYLSQAPNAAERAKIEQRIVQLRQDYADQFDYFISLIQSDLEYLKRFYDSVYNRSSKDLAREFIGFVNEKRDFYAALAEILEADESWLKYLSKDISSSIDTLARRYNMPNFDMDAISLLTIPISEIEDLIERLNDYRGRNIR